MSSQGATESSQADPREHLRSFLKAKSEFGEAQKSSPEALKSFENDLKIKNFDFHETIDNSMKIIEFSSSEGEL